MVEFSVDKDVFKKFLEVCCMQGTIQFRDNKGISKPLFSSFYLNVFEDRLEVLTVDPYTRKTRAEFILRDIIGIEQGEIPIIDFNAIMSCLGGKGISGLITVSNRDSIITLESDKDVYEIRQKGRIFYDDLKDKEKVKTLNALQMWKDWHQFDEQGMLHMYAEMKGKTVDAPYPMKLKVNKKDLLKVVGDTLNIMKDNKTKLVFHEGKFLAYKGEENAKIKSRHEIPYEPLLDDIIEFEDKFKKIQTVVPNLFDEIELNFRRINADGSLAIFIRSIDEKLNIEINIGLISVLEGGD